MKRMIWLAAVASMALSASAGELLVTSFFSDQVGRYSLADGSHLGALQSGVGLDGALAARVGPDGLLYVASEGTDTIQRYRVTTGAFVDTFVAAGSGGLDGPTGMTWGPDGDIYVPSFNTDEVLRYDGQTGAFVEIAVAAGEGSLNGPDNGAIFGPDGALYVPSYWNNRVLRYDLTSGVVSTFVSVINRPRVLIFDGDRLLITAEGGHTVKTYDPTSGEFLGNLVSAGAGGLNGPVGMALDGDELFVTSSNNSVLRYDATSGEFLGEFISPGLGGINGPVFLTVVPEPTAGVLMVLGAALIATRAQQRR